MTKSQELEERFKKIFAGLAEIRAILDGKKAGEVELF